MHLGRLRWGELQFKASPGKMLKRSPSQPMTGYVSTHLSSQLCRRLDLEDWVKVTLGKKSSETPSQWKKIWVWWHAPTIPTTIGNIEGPWSRPSWTKRETLSQNITRKKRLEAWVMGRVPSKHEVLNSSPVPQKKFFCLNNYPSTRLHSYDSVYLCYLQKISKLTFLRLFELPLWRPSYSQGKVQMK
jgi:hypothetical protein